MYFKQETISHVKMRHDILLKRNYLLGMYILLLNTVLDLSLRGKCIS